MFVGSLFCLGICDAIEGVFCSLFRSKCLLFIVNYRIGFANNEIRFTK